MSQEDKAESESLHLRTTPALLAVFDEKLPEHKYETSFPAKILSDASFSGLASLLTGTAVYFPRLTETNQDEGGGYRARMRALEASLAEASYQSLVAPRETVSASGLTIASSCDTSDKEDERREKNQISTMINIAISMMTAAMAAWYWTPQGVSLPKRVLICFASAIALGAAEVFLYLRYLVKIDQGREYDRDVTQREQSLKQKDKKEKRT